MSKVTDVMDQIRRLTTAEVLELAHMIDSWPYWPRGDAAGVVAKLKPKPPKLPATAKAPVVRKRRTTK